MKVIAISACRTRARAGFSRYPVRKKKTSFTNFSSRYVAKQDLTLSRAKVLAYAGDVSRFSSAKALSAFAGLCPRQRLSGTSVKGRTLVSKRGHAELRKALYMPGMVAMRFNRLVQDMAQRLKAKGMAPKAIIAAAMHKLVHLIYGVLKTRQPFDMHWASKTTEVIKTTALVATPQKFLFSRLTFKTVSDPDDAPTWACITNSISTRRGLAMGNAPGNI